MIDPKLAFDFVQAGEDAYEKNHVRPTEAGRELKARLLRSIDQSFATTLLSIEKNPVPPGEITQAAAAVLRDVALAMDSKLPGFAVFVAYMLFDAVTHK